MQASDQWAVGQEVRVFDVNARVYPEPEMGWPGEVVKVGRKLMIVRVERGYSHDIVFRLDTGRTNDNYEHQFVLPVQEAIDNAEVQRLSRVLWQAIPKLTLQELRRLVAALDVNT